jgi:hypothetical protein
VPIPDTVSSTFSDVISPRAWERADIILGGMEAQYGNKAAAVLDITTKSGTKPSFGSVQVMGGSNQDHQSVLRVRRHDRRKVPVLYLEQPHGHQSGHRAADVGPIRSIYGQSERNQTFIRGDYQHDNKKQLHLVVPELRGQVSDPHGNRAGDLDPSGQMLPLLQAGAAPGSRPSPRRRSTSFRRKTISTATWSGGTM